MVDVFIVFKVIVAAKPGHFSAKEKSSQPLRYHRNTRKCILEVTTIIFTAWMLRYRITFSFTDFDVYRCMFVTSNCIKEKFYCLSRDR